MWLLVRPDEVTDAELRAVHVLYAHRPLFSRTVIRRFLLPYGQDVLDRLADQGAAIGVAADLEELDVGGQAPGSDPHQEPSAGEMVEQRGLPRDLGRMLIGQAEHPGPELDGAGFVEQGRQEYERRRDRLDRGTGMLADPALLEPQPVRQDDGLAIFFENLSQVPGRIVHRLHE